MLVLLIIFMVTAPLVTQGVNVDLPKAEAEALDEDSKPPLVASVDAQGQYFINVGDTQEEALSAVDLATLVAAHLKVCLLYTSPSPRDKRQSRMPSSA